MVGNSVNMKLTGDVFSGLNALAAEKGEAMLRAGGYAGASLLRDEAVINAKKNAITHVLERNIIVKRRDEKSDGAKSQTYIVVVRKGKVNSEGDAYYANWVEEGHKIVGKKAKGVTWKAHRAAAAMKAEFGNSQVPAHPYMRPAWTSLKGSVIEVMRSAMERKFKELLGQS